MAISNEIRQLRASATMSAREMAEFCRQIRGKSVPEALGVIAQSQLSRALIESTAACLAVLVLGTIPFYFLGGSKRSTEAAPAAAAAPGTAVLDEGANAGAMGEAEATAKSGDLPATVEEAEKKLGIDTKAPSLDPRVNPLESKGDDLLKDLK